MKIHNKLIVNDNSEASVAISQSVKAVHKGQEFKGETSFKEKISIPRCREILCTNGLDYTEDEIIEIRDFLYELASIADAQVKLNTHNPIIIPLNSNNTGHNEESHYLRTG